MSAYTKGPLLVKVFAQTIAGDYDYHVCTEREECIATCWGQDEIAEANAKLFAASHELLEALKATLAYLNPTSRPAPEEIHKMVSAAISKAEGK